MNRKEFLQKLLEKAERGHDYVRTNLYDTSDNMSPPATIKRMQILQMGMGKIYLPQAKPTEPVFQKQVSANNRKILVLQKVKSMSHRRETPPTNNKSLRNTFVPQQIQNVQQKEKTLFNSPTLKTAKTQNSQKQQKQVMEPKSETYSPIKHSSSAINKRNESVSDSIKKIKVGTSRAQNRYLLRSVQFKKQPNTQSPNATNLLQRRPSVTRKSKELNDMKNVQKESRAAMKREIRKNYSKVFLPTPKISAKSYIVYERISINDGLNSQFKIHLAFNSKIRVQVASLTKIMTCIIALEICERLKVDARREEIKIGKFESGIGGTSAKIESGDVYTLEDMYYGLMLPSGNDASLAIAVWGGKKLMSEERKDETTFGVKRMKKQYYERFIQEMNKKARELEMSKTTYANSHGLINTMNRSCAHDIAHLSQYAMKNSQFRKIVSTKFYTTRVKMFEKKISFKEIEKTSATKHQKRNYFNEDRSDYDDESSVEEKEEYQQIEEEVYLGEREVTWQNTHKLLHSNSKEYLGIKTGVTTAAGPCLSSCVMSECGRTFYIVVLNCKKMLLRFKQTDLLKKWIFKQQGLKKAGKTKSPGSEITSVASEQNNDLSDVEEKYGPDDD